MGFEIEKHARGFTRGMEKCDLELIAHSKAGPLFCDTLIRNANVICHALCGIMEKDDTHKSEGNGNDHLAYVGPRTHYACLK